MEDCMKINIGADEIILWLRKNNRNKAKKRHLIKCGAAVSGIGIQQCC
jgi:hypothetical protein